MTVAKHISQEVSPEHKELHIDVKQCHAQTQSPLFSICPPEVRNRIFRYALAQYEDKTREFDHDTCYRRPDYSAPCRCDTALLRTCRLVYHEAWFRPQTGSTHDFFLAWEDRRPECATEIYQSEKVWDMIQRRHGYVEVDHIRVFAQLCELDTLQQVLDVPGLHPRSVTIVIRHTDWYSWEYDNSLYISSDFVNNCRFPDSVREINMELESLERKKNQIDYIASRIAASWQFRRRDGTKLTAKYSNSVNVSKWSGSSIFGGVRWVRDESRPLVLDYHIATVTWQIFKKEKVLEQEDEGQQSLATHFHSRRLHAYRLA